MPELAYLVIREGSKWTDVFRLVPGQLVTIGRAPTNQIVIKDERVSRSHAEIFMSEGKWYLRDLESRNGTAVGNQLIRNDWPLKPGDVVRIGRSQLVFVYNLSDAFPESGTVVSRDPAPPPTGVSTNLSEEDIDVLAGHGPTTITHRRDRARLLDSAESEEAGVSQLGRAAARLCRLAFELGKAPDVKSMAETALEGLFQNVKIDAGAIYVAPRDTDEPPTADNLTLVASKTTSKYRYFRVSGFLAGTVLREGEAVLARNVMGDSAIASRDSQGEIRATSVICAPIRQGNKVLGIIHVYSTVADCELDPQDLEFTLAVADTVSVALGNLTRREELAQNLTQVRTENYQLRERLGIQSEIVGRSEAIVKINEEIARAAASKATVLIRGESGVGKELVARAVHYSSPRRDHTFVCLNCAALSEELLASELFGHEKGAFTGAYERKIGKFELAHQGTIMLDEIGEMSPGIQAKFLRVLEGHPFERLGGSKAIKVDVRVIAATNRDLEKEVAEGRFRRDLFFRLRVLEIVVPPLRKRVDDIPVLAYYFLNKFREETGRKIKGFTQRAMDRLVSYRWPGNVRELKNVIERAVVLCRGDAIDQEDLLLSSLNTAGDTADAMLESAYRPCSLAEMEKAHIAATLKHTNWNKSRSAMILGIERSTLDRKIRRYGIARE
ncbi:sigma 54-interacting transcriptional regulator [Thermostilla marina]